MLDSTNESPLIFPMSVGAGEELHVGDNEAITVPPWLKRRLPRCISPSRHESLVDLRLPVDYNLFYTDMVEHMSSSAMMTTLEAAPTGNDHILLLGSSGTVHCFLVVSVVLCLLNC